MKSKKLGRSELLNWVNKTIESDYMKIEDLSDGVGFCQIIDAFFKNVSKEMNGLKLNAINEIELKNKNLCLLNSLLGKAGCIKHIDPNKLSKGLF
jgi:RP/EB family microtubule-associated protein